GVPLISQPSTAPKAEHWEGEPSLSFDVTESGEIQNLEMTVPFPMGSCTIKLDTVDQEGGEYVFGDPSDQDYPQYITGKFTNSETFKGVYAISVCQSGDNYSVALDVEEEPLTAKWKEP
ncbi:MAG: hypothetical protein JXA14_12540, partial [Anaerolineae bacterium]|nr:hypothetical protein [Anaerolineae bacterium]